MNDASFVFQTWNVWFENYSCCETKPSVFRFLRIVHRGFKSSILHPFYWIHSVRLKSETKYNSTVTMLHDRVTLEVVMLEVEWLSRA